MSECITLLANIGYPLEKHFWRFIEKCWFSLANGVKLVVYVTATYKVSLK